MQIIAGKYFVGYYPFHDLCQPIFIYSLIYQNIILCHFRKLKAERFRYGII